MIDKKSQIYQYTIGIFAGVLLGIITSVFLASILINAIGDSFKVDNMNVSVSLQESLIREAINASIENRLDEIRLINATTTKTNEYELAKEYDKGFINGAESISSNILFAGSTFKYDNYTIKLQNLQPGKAFIEVIQGGNYIFNGTCYENKWCNIRDVSFQIDNIHIGKEAAYFVYWSDK